jgi:hypothetical protein
MRWLEMEMKLTCATLMTASSTPCRFHFTMKILIARTSTAKMTERIVVMINGALLSSGVTSAKRFPVGGAGWAIFWSGLSPFTPQLLQRQQSSLNCLIVSMMYCRTIVALIFCSHEASSLSRYEQRRTTTRRSRFFALIHIALGQTPVETLFHFFSPTSNIILCECGCLRLQGRWSIRSAPTLLGTEYGQSSLSVSAEGGRCCDTDRGGEGLLFSGRLSCQELFSEKGTIAAAGNSFRAYRTAVLVSPSHQPDDSSR